MRKLKTTISTIAICLSIEMTGIALGEELLPYEFSLPDVGTEFTYRNLTTGVMVNHRFLDSSVLFKRLYVLNNSKEKAQYLFCKYCGSNENEIDLDGYRSLFPLEVGKSVEFARWKKENPERSWTHTIQVDEVKQVASQVSEVPINVFVLNETINHNTKAWQGKVTYWFSPELNANVNIIDNAGDDLDKLSIIQLVQVKGR
ncbi:MAG: hypothetical protein KTR18_10510 [Acidiferrobacterales bacterium]|nr:hypothetical protein [Acidiferrobacterales bacterium]